MLYNQRDLSGLTETLWPMESRTKIYPIRCPGSSHHCLPMGRAGPRWGGRARPEPPPPGATSPFSVSRVPLLWDSQANTIQTQSQDLFSKNTFVWNALCYGRNAVYFLFNSLLRTRTFFTEDFYVNNKKTVCSPWDSCRSGILTHCKNILPFIPKRTLNNW